ncbi:MAG: hypothetical protein ACR652_10320 [Methylocystis sp.]|uniref:hypothetical protein n=1 Tax=Methylocystis sp. TaxID=1911079 RepID=UPI003DA2BA0A
MRASEGSSTGVLPTLTTRFGSLTLVQFFCDQQARAGHLVALRRERKNLAALQALGRNGFDLPLLRYRAFALGVPVPGLHNGGRRNYWHRFGQDHIDLCDVLSSYGASTKPSLAEMAELANIPVKIGGVDGSQVEAFVAAEVADYCLTDVLATFCVFLRHEMVRGDLRQAHFEASMDNLRAIIRKHVEQRPLLSVFL